MEATEQKLVKKFGLTAEEVAALTALKLRTPRDIEAADQETIPSAIRAKLARLLQA